MKKLLLYFGAIVVLSGFCYFIYNTYKPNENGTTDSIKFSNEYGKVDKENVFVYKNSKEIIEILKTGTGVVYLGFPECPWCQAYVKYLNEVAIEEGINEIYYFNIKSDRANNTENYRKIVEILEKDLLLNDEGNKRVYVPDVTFVKDGVIVAHDNETSVVSEEDGTPETYWTDEKINTLKNKLKGYLKMMKSNICTSCN